MKRIIKFEWNRMIHSKTLLISLIISYSIIAADVVAWYQLYRDGIDVYTSVFYKWLGVNRGTNSGVYFFMAFKNNYKCDFLTFGFMSVLEWSVFCAILLFLKG